MIVDYDFLIVGSGPAGVSAAFPLLDAGKRVLMIDGGSTPEIDTPNDNYLSLRATDSDQVRWMVGADFHALKEMDAVSPKLRVPTHAYAFEGFLEANRIVAPDFVSVGSLAPGGLSNSWGCGVARFGDHHLGKFPCSISEMDDSYAVVAERMGISGSNKADDLSSYFGLDSWSSGEVEMDRIHQRLYSRYQKCKSKVNASGVRVGRSRVSVLTQDRGERKACNLSGNCLWGCSRRSLYSATEDLSVLRTRPGFEYESGVVADKLIQNPGGWVVHCSTPLGERRIRADKVLLAAGTLASTRLALDTIEYKKSRPLLSCPTAAFLAWSPAMLGSPIQSGFGLGQLSYSVDIAEGVCGFGSTFSPTGIAVSEFIRYLPFGARNSVKIMRSILTSCVVGNLFLPGHFANAEVRLDAEAQLVVSGGLHDDVESYMRTGHKSLLKAFLHMGALIIPTSFSVGSPGSDIHYAGTLPLKNDPTLGETGKFGELYGVTGLYVVDGASLPTLSEQSHTLTIMANADRIGRYLATTS
ncbi:MAG: choline dehydrogenase-like flavoprotein [Candidatus Azotimanducaceae bacterium]|jgi:choline dehydrogenase-like flavoprotein